MALPQREQLKRRAYGPVNGKTRPRIISGGSRHKARQATCALVCRRPLQAEPGIDFTNPTGSRSAPSRPVPATRTDRRHRTSRIASLNIDRTWAWRDITTIGHVQHVPP